MTTPLVTDVVKKNSNQVFVNYLILLKLNGVLFSPRTPDTLIRSLILNNRKDYKSTSYDASNVRKTA